MNARALLIWLLLAVPAHAQGFAGMGSDSSGFTLPKPGVALSFPADHAMHPDYRIEWWYVTANLAAADGTQYGVQWTLFRSALAPAAGEGWSSPQMWMGHAALTEAARQHVAERFARGGIGQAGVVASPFSAWIDEWQLSSRAAAGADPLSAIDLGAGGTDFAYHLALDATGPLVLQGEQGYSVKSDRGQASYYYSQPFYRAKGTLTLAGRTVEVTGQAWLDREWSSQPLAADQSGWDWFSLHFDDGAKLMVYHLRDKGPGYISATWIEPGGRSAPQGPGTVSLTPLAATDVAGRKVPTRWRVRFPAKGIDVTTTPLNDRAWMDTRIPYWEGPVRFEGSHAGRGYLEMTGYE